MIASEGDEKDDDEKDDNEKDDDKKDDDEKNDDRKDDNVGLYEGSLKGCAFCSLFLARW